ncbi:hypothetical protein EC973_004592 [Apophysomyces ossiformis]|uniref:BZIP domain-containing protein n=1 Tax=Apophysomyces ossiformis TaxID=679940 RepID=A0A8H7BV00_9FUNG|nr:hypothetical protein EC973_004592 [Apophysomyces ossiformis]
MSYISQLNLLGDDSPLPISEESLTEELSLWANAQFTFDSEPGSALLNDQLKGKPTENMFQTLSSFSELAHPPVTTGSADKTTTKSENNSTSIGGFVQPYVAPSFFMNPVQHHQQPIQSVHPVMNPTSLPRLAPAPAGNAVESVLLPETPAARKRKASNDHEPSEKAAAEEDKRRRNTAASARFRMKKKLREQALEQTAKEMTEKAEALEQRVKELEMEAKWLRALVVEKDPRLLNEPHGEA